MKALQSISITDWIFGVLGIVILLYTSETNDKVINHDGVTVSLGEVQREVVTYNVDITSKSLPPLNVVGIGVEDTLEVVEAHLRRCSWYECNLSWVRVVTTLTVVYTSSNYPDTYTISAGRTSTIKHTTPSKLYRVVSGSLDEVEFAYEDTLKIL